MQGADESSVSIVVNNRVIKSLFGLLQCGLFCHRWQRCDLDYDLHHSIQQTLWHLWYGVILCCSSWGGLWRPNRDVALIPNCCPTCVKVVWNRLRRSTAIMAECVLCRLRHFTNWIRAKGHSPSPTNCQRVGRMQVLQVFTLKTKQANHNANASISKNDGGVVTNGPWHRNSDIHNILVWAPFRRERNTLTWLWHTTRQNKHSWMFSSDDGIHESQLQSKSLLYLSKNWFRSTWSSSS